MAQNNFIEIMNQKNDRELLDVIESWEYQVSAIEAAKKILSQRKMTKAKILKKLHDEFNNKSNTELKKILTSPQKYLQLEIDECLKILQKRWITEKEIEQISGKNMEMLTPQEQFEKKRQKNIKWINSYGITVAFFGTIMCLLSLSWFAEIIRNRFWWSDLIMVFLVGIFLGILGLRIMKRNDQWITKYIYTVTIIATIMWLATSINTWKSNWIWLILLFSSCIAWFKSKFLYKPVNSEYKYFIQGTARWILLIVFMFIVFLLGLTADIYKEAGWYMKEIDIDKSEKNVERINNLYRNKKYKFRIKFPEWWEQQVWDGQHILVKASTEKANMNIEVRHFEWINTFTKISDYISLDDFSSTVQEAFPNWKILEKKEIKIDNQEAYLVKYDMEYSANQITISAIMSTYYVYKNGFLFQITSWFFHKVNGKEIPIDKNIIEKMEQSVRTFVFED